MSTIRGYSQSNYYDSADNDYSAYNQNASSFLAGLSINSGNSNNNGIMGGINLSDYASIKNGSYGKLVKAYYAKQKADGASSGRDSSAKLTSMGSAAGTLAKSASALMKDSLWEKKHIKTKDEKTGEETTKEDYDYFVGRVAKIAQKYGKTPIGWDPIDTSNQINSNVILQNWKDSNEAAVKKEMNIITSISSKAYLDMKYNEDTPYGLSWAGYIPVDVAYKWDPTDYAPKKLILGVEAPLWTETISTQEQMDYMIYPRLPGYAEIGWTPKENRNWDEYKMRLKEQGIRMEYQGINYYKDPSIWGEYR